MRLGPTIAVIAAFSFVAACQRHDEARVPTDLKSAGKDLGAIANHTVHDPAWKQAGAELKAAGHDLGHDASKAAAEAKDAVRTVAHDAKRSAHDVTHDSGDH